MTDTNSTPADNDVPDMPDEVVVPDEASDDWQPEGYEPGPDDPGPVTTECGPGNDFDDDEADDV